jgi:ribosomal protein S2
MASKLPSVLSATEEEIQLLLAAQSHIGTKNCDKQMEPYVWKRRLDGEFFHLSLRVLVINMHIIYCRHPHN